MRSFLIRVSGFLACAFCLLVAGAPGLHAQSSEGGSVTALGGDALQVGGLVQTDVGLGRDGNDGFRARSARVRLGGQAESLTYVLQTELASSEVILDAVTRLSLTNRVQLSAGLFKTPYSSELLTARPNLLFAERARVVNNLAPARQVGATLSGALLPGRLTATLGVFNGPRGPQTNDNDHLLYVGRLASTHSVAGMDLILGANAGYSIDDQVEAPRSVAFSGRRVLIGGDARVQSNRWLLTGEVHYAALDPDASGQDDYRPFGYYLAGGVDVTPDHQVLARFDRYDPDRPGLTSSKNQVTLGYNFFITSVVRALANYQAPTDDLGSGAVTLRLQAALQ